jgi:hypothetical protein
MANIYVRSTDGNNADNGSTWALAKADLTGATAADSAGDIIYVSQSHAESTAGAITISLAGTTTSPSQIVGVSDAAEPPTTLSTSPTVTTSNGHINLYGSCLIKGITFRAGSGQTGSTTYGFLIAGSGSNNNMRFEDSSLEILTTGTGAALIQLGDETRTDAARFMLKNCTVKLGGTAQRIKISGDLEWRGGSFIAGAANPTSVFQAGLRGIGKFLVEGVDFSNLGTSFNLIQQTSGGNAFVARFTNCTLPTGWTGSLWSGTPGAPGQRGEIYNSVIGSAKLRCWVQGFAGTVRDETTVVRTGGASDDGTAISLKMTTTADAEYPTIAWEGVPITTYVNSTSSTTVSVEIVHDSQGAGTGGAFRNDQIGLKVTYPGGVVETIKSDPLATATDITTSTETWTTTGLSSPVKQKLSATFTPARKGEVTVIPVIYAASKTVYICPKLGG